MRVSGAEVGRREALVESHLNAMQYNYRSKEDTVCFLRDSRSPTSAFPGRAAVNMDQSAARSRPRC
jgi:hypothetical protein